MSKATIRILESGDEPVLDTFLLPYAESSMFLIGNMRASGLVDNGQAYTGTYAAAFEDERIIGVVAHYWNQNLIFQAPVHLDLLWRAAVEASQRPVAGLIGPNDQVSAVKEILQIDESKIQFDELENLYSLRLKDLRIPDELSSGKLRGRQIAPHDLELLTQWGVAYSVETLGDIDTPQLWKRCRMSAEGSLNERRTWILEDGGKPVACSSFNAAIKEAVQVGGVWTPPELRNRGYGRSVVAASLLDARCEGVEKSILFTGEGNLTAQKVYAALGFERIGKYRLMLLRLPVDAI